jgi:hypothetical protein
MRPYVPPPTAMKKPAVQIEVTTRPTGKKARLCPGTTKGSADWTAAEAAAAALGSTLDGPLADFAKTPLTNEASPEDKVVSTSAPETGFLAARSIWGMRSGLSESLVTCQ